MADRPDDYKDIAKTAEARWRAESRDDLQNEIGNRDTGRMTRFLTGETAAKSEKQKERDRTDRLLTELERWLRDPDYRALHEGFGKFLSSAETATETALSNAERALAEGQEQLQSLLENANALQDGTMVFRAEDGRIMDEHGNVVSAEDAAGIVWKDGAPSYEEYLAAKQRAEDAQRLIDDIRRYQTDVLGRARDRWEDPNNPITPEEMEEWRERINELNPNASKADSYEIETPDEVKWEQSTAVAKPPI